MQNISENKLKPLKTVKMGVALMRIITVRFNDSAVDFHMYKLLGVLVGVKPHE